MSLGESLMRAQPVRSPTEYMARLMIMLRHASNFSGKPTWQGSLLVSLVDGRHQRLRRAHQRETLERCEFSLLGFPWTRDFLPGLDSGYAEEGLVRPFCHHLLALNQRPCVSFKSQQAGSCQLRR